MANATEGKVLYKGKEGVEGKAEATRDYKAENKSINNALDNEMFKDLVKFAPKKPEFKDGAFDIDNADDRKAMRTLVLSLDGLDDAEQAEMLGLLHELDELMKEKAAEVEEVIVDAKRAVDTHKADVLADLDNNGEIGSVRNERKNARKDEKNTAVEAKQKDIIHEIYALTDLTNEEQDAVIDMARSGKYQGINFANRMRKDYIAGQVAAGVDAKDAGKAFSHIETTLRGAGLRDDLRRVNRFEKTSDRKEAGRERSRETNKEELNLDEDAIKAVFDSLTVMYGKDGFAKKLDARLQRAAVGMQNVDAGAICFDTYEEMMQVMANEEKAGWVKRIFAQELKYLDVSSLKTWLDGQPDINYTHMDELELTEEGEQTLEETAEAIAAKIKDIPADQQKALKPWIAGAISSYFTGLGGGAVYDVKSKLLDAVVVGAGMSASGPGLMLDLNKSVTLGKKGGGSMTINAGAMNMIPFARLDLDKTINAKKIRETLTPKATKKIGVYAEVAGPYYGAGVKLIDTNYMEGVNKQADAIQGSFETMLTGLDVNSSRKDIDAMLKKAFKGAQDEDITNATDHILSGLNQGYSAADIAATFAQAWENAGTKKASKKVDVRAEVGVGMIGAIPVLKAFVGLGFYRRAILRENKDSRAVAKASEQAFAGAEKIEKGTLMEKVNGFFAGYTVVESGDLVTITQPEGAKQSIYDALNIYVNGTAANVTENALTFSKNSPLHFADLIHPDGRKEKSVYIGFTAADTGSKRELNAVFTGSPETVKKATKEIKKTEKTTTEVKTESTVDMWEAMAPKNAKGEYDQEFISFIAGAFNGQSFIDITKTGNPNKLAYNKAFGQFIDATTTMNDAAMTKALIEMENKMGGKSGITNVLNKWNTLDASHKLYAAKMLIQTASHSAKVDEILNDADGKVQGKKGQLENIGALLMDRSGHEKAFANAGLVMPKGAFDAIYDKAKNINKNTDVSIVGYQNAVSLVGYYRNGLTPTVGVLGLGSVQIIDGPDYRQSVDKKGGEYKAFMDTYMKSAEAAQQKAALQNIIKGQTGAALSDAEYSTLLNTGALKTKNATITLPSDFFKALNGPCANESYILNFGDLNIKTSTMKIVDKPTSTIEVIEPDQTMAVDVVTGRQQTKKVNIGLGFSVKQETRSNAPKSGTQTGEHDQTSGTTTEDGDPVDPGNGADDIPGGGDDIPGTGTNDIPAGPTVADPTIKKTTYDGGAGMGAGARSGSKNRANRTQ